MNNEYDSDKEGDQPRSEAGSGYHDDGTTPTSHESKAASRKPSRSYLNRMAGDLRRNGEESPDSQEHVIDGELIPEIRREVLRQVTQVTSVWSGPTPSPETLEAFNKIDPSFAERAFKMSERTVETSNYERRALADGDVAAVKRGQWMAWSTSIGGVVGAVYLAANGQPWVAAALVSPAVFQFLGTLVRTVREKQVDKESSDDEMGKGISTVE